MSLVIEVHPDEFQNRWTHDQCVPESVDPVV